MQSNSCPRCQGTMREGFILDNAQNRRTVSQWVEGAPEAGFWTGIKLGGRARYDIQTWRCGRCGFLESYAKG